MTALLGWLPIVAVLGAGGALIGAVASLAIPRLLPHLRKLEPSARFHFLSLLALLPALLAAFLVVVTFMPSTLEILGIVADHCSHHLGKAFHVCILHTEPPGVGTGLAAFALLMGVFGIWNVALELYGFQRVRAVCKSLESVSTWDEQVGGWIVPGNEAIAWSVGFLAPRVFVSSALREELTEAQFAAVLAHERAHAARRDALVKLAVRIFSMWHTPALGRSIRHEIELACEQACDESAAQTVGDRLTVAEAIVATRRFALGRTSVGISSFGGGDLEARVRALVDGRWVRVRSRWLFGIAGLAIFAFARTYDALHHGAEHVLARLL